MRLRRRALSTALAIAGMALPAATASALSHMNQTVTDHVAISFVASKQPGECQSKDVDAYLQFSRVMPSGAVVPFVIPQGHLLVVTDFDLTTRLEKAYHVEGGTLETTLRIKTNGQNPQAGSSVFKSEFHMNSDLPQTSFALSFQSLAGMVVGSDASLCPRISYTHVNGDYDLLEVISGHYRGYLIEEPVDPDERMRELM